MRESVQAQRNDEFCFLGRPHRIHIKEENYPAI